MPVVTGVVAVAVLAVGYGYALKPMIGRVMSGGVYDAAPYRAALEDEKNYQSTLKAKVSEYESINESRRGAIAAMIPTTSDLPGIYVALDDLAKKRGITLLSVDAVPAAEADEFGHYPIQVSARFSGGGYGLLKTVLLDIERSRRLFDVQSLVFSPESDSISLTMVAYYIDPIK